MKLWKKVRQNIYRNLPSGNYYLRLKVMVAGKPRNFMRCLGVDSADALTDALIARARAKIRISSKSTDAGYLLLADCLEEYLMRLRERGFSRGRRTMFRPHKPRSLDYREETAKAVVACWPGWAERRGAQVTPAECHQVADRLRRRFKSASRFNGCVQTMRGILAIAVEAGALESNPAAGVGLIEPTHKEKRLPTREQFTEVLRLLDSHPRRNWARLSVRALAFTGLRPNEARHLTAADVDLANGILTARETKNGKPRQIVLLPQARELFEQEGVATVLEALRHDPRRTVRTLSAKVGVKMTPYIFRHYFLTTLVESGLDIGAVADIAGHQDSGVTLLRHYRHRRTQHLRSQLERVVF